MSLVACSRGCREKSGRRSGGDRGEHTQGRCKYSSYAQDSGSHCSADSGRKKLGCKGLAGWVPGRYPRDYCERLR